jgi:hypothetical protein
MYEELASLNENDNSELINRPVNAKVIHIAGLSAQKRHVAAALALRLRWFGWYMHKTKEYIMMKHSVL